MQRFRTGVVALCLVTGSGLPLWGDDPTSRFVALAAIPTSLPAGTSANAVQFEMWDQASGGNLISTEGHTVDTDSNANITNDTNCPDLLLGRPGGLVPDNYPAGQSRYLDVTQGGSSVLTARIPLYATVFTMSMGVPGPPGPAGPPGPQGPPGSSSASGGVQTVSPGDGSIVIGGSPANPTVAVAAVPAFALSGEYPAVLAFSNPANIFIGSGERLTKLNAASLAGGIRVLPDSVSPIIANGFSGNGVRAAKGSSIMGATIAGGGESGSANTVTGNFGTIGGGHGNTAELESTVSGGAGNQAISRYSSVGGGFENTATGVFSTVPGGNSNSAAGANSFAAGNRAKATHPGAFVWADDTAADFASTASNQFLIRAGGGVGINTDAPSEKLEVAGRVKATAFIGNGAQLKNVTATGLAAGTYSNAYTFSNSSNSFTGNGSGLTNLRASNLTGALSSAALSGTFPNALDFSNPANIFTGNGAGLTNLNATSLTRGITVQPNGDVGIGTAAPKARLDVAGNLSIGGDAPMSSNPRMSFSGAFPWSFCSDNTCGATNPMRNSVGGYFVPDRAIQITRVTLSISETIDATCAFLPGDPLGVGIFLNGTTAPPLFTLAVVKGSNIVDSGAISVDVSSGQAIVIALVGAGTGNCGPGSSGGGYGFVNVQYAMR